MELMNTCGTLSVHNWGRSGGLSIWKKSQMINIRNYSQFSKMDQKNSISLINDMIKRRMLDGGIRKKGVGSPRLRSSNSSGWRTCRIIWSSSSPTRMFGMICLQRMVVLQVQVVAEYSLMRSPWSCQRGPRYRSLTSLTTNSNNLWQDAVRALCHRGAPLSKSSIRERKWWSTKISWSRMIVHGSV